MADVMLPFDLRHARTSFRYLDSTGISRGTFTGALVTAARGGDKLAATLEFTRHGGGTASGTGASERALLRSFLASLRGRQNRAYLYDLSYRRRGNFPTGELLTNNTFANGTTGWSATNSTISAADRVLRFTKAGSVGGTVAPSANPISVTQYAAYVVRMFARFGAGNLGGIDLRFGTSASDGSYLSSSSLTENGLLTHAGVVGVTSGHFSFNAGAVSGISDSADIHFVSMSRCMLVDNGRNALTFSDQLDNAAHTKTEVTVSANAITAPDGTSTADSITESAANAQHFISDGSLSFSATQEYFVGGAFKQGTTRSRVAVGFFQGANNGYAIFDLTNGTVVTTSAGGTVTDVRGAAMDLGSGWYYCGVVLKPGTTSSSWATLFNTVSGTSLSFAGNNGGVALYGWRLTASQASASAAQGGTFQRLVQTTSTANAGGTSQTGSAVYVRALPASTNGLLEVDDQIEIVTSRGSELKLVTARLNSDAAGLGYLQFEPPLRNSPADNAAVIVHQPMMRGLFTGDAVGWDNSPGFWSNASAEFEEAI
jgi:hypothetical protein